MDRVEKRKELLKLRSNIKTLKALNMQKRINFKRFMDDYIIIEKKILELEEQLNVKRL